MATIANSYDTPPSSGQPQLQQQQQRRQPRKQLGLKATVSPRSKILKLPEISRLGLSEEDSGGGSHVRTKPDHFPEPPEKKRNPFHLPNDLEVFALREEERRLKHEAKEKLKNLRIYEKNVQIRKGFKDLLKEEADDVDFYDELRKRDADKILINRHARADRHFGKENLHDFIAKKREMFLVQYALGVKRQEMRKLEEIAQAEEQKLLDDEKALEEDAAKFDAFLKENDKNSVEAIKRAEMETKAKLEKIQEIKKLNVQIMSIRSDMSKNEDQLKDLQRYRQFLDKLTPAEFFEEVRRKKMKDAEKKKGDMDDASSISKYANNPPETPHQKSRTSTSKRNKQTKSGSSNRNNADNPDSENGGSLDAGNESANEDEANNTGGGAVGEDGEEEFWNEEDEPLLYFKHPQQLLDLFAELEENNLALIQNCQETEETLEELKQKILETEERMYVLKVFGSVNVSPNFVWNRDKETLSLTQQIDFLNEAIAREEEKARMLEERSKLFQSGLVGAESQEELLEELNHKVKEVYRKCIGDSDANLSTLQMLTSIENKLEQLFELIELMPPEKVEQAEKMKDKERRQRLREEKMEAQRALQEERVQRALERARAPVKKKTGKPVVFRSAPPQKKKPKEEFTKKKEEEDLEYYFS
ncbi:Coiled-coil domain-containing protein 38 [Irineochytrium annulatum]|nr:Coiled-coil domain-containing protein 38 [Irineochytrium annulatum]